MYSGLDVLFPWYAIATGFSHPKITERKALPGLYLNLVNITWQQTDNRIKSNGTLRDKTAFCIVAVETFFFPANLLT